LTYQIFMVLRDLTSISRPTTPFKLTNNNVDIEIKLIDYFRCLDTASSETEDDDDSEALYKPGRNDEENEDESSDENIYSKEKQKELSYTKTMLIKSYGVLNSGHSITMNLQKFQPFFYIKVPDDWTKKHCSIFVKHLKKDVYYKYSQHLIASQLIIRKPFSEFTGTDKFKFLKLQFKNKESYDSFAYKIMKNPLKYEGLNGNKAYKYELFESNLDPILKFIHLTKIQPCGWVRIPKKSYQIISNDEKSAHTNFEITLDWDKIQPLDKVDAANINIAAFDIEADSSHGDFPIGIKNYQKLSQDLITFYNQSGVQTKRQKKHRLLTNSTDVKTVISNLLGLVFNDNYNNNAIHQIRTLENLKPHPKTVNQLAFAIYQIFDQCCQLEISNDEFFEQVTDLFEYNLPAIDTEEVENSHYGLLARELTMQMFTFNRNNNKQFKTKPIEVIEFMINLAFNENFDAFNVNCIYTKNNIKPKKEVIDALVPDIYRILNNCAQFVHFKKMPEPSTFTTADGMVYNKDTMAQDAFVKLLTQLLDTNLPDVEGDKLIQIGTTFQLSGEPDCYLKHMICLGSCDKISNDELISSENADIYLPSEDLATDLINYERQLIGKKPLISNDDSKELIKAKIKEIKSWDLKYRQLQCKKAAEYRRVKQSLTDKSRVVVECYDTEKEVLLAWQELITRNDPDVVVGYNIFGFDFKFLYERSLETGCSEDFCQLGRLKGLIEQLHVQELSSKGMGDNSLRYIPMNGRVLIDLYKIIQKEYKLDSYKLDRVCHKYLYKEKLDLPPQEIFILQKGQSHDRKTIAVYCLIDCILCNRLLLKLEIIGNNMAMANVCKVPFPYLFLRGQGVKIFSLVADFCSNEGFLIPVLPKADPLNDDKFEGAIVLKPFIGIYFTPIAVADFNSLYPSSMISENLSHDSFVKKGGKYDNLPGYEYVDIEYDIYKWTTLPGKKKKIKVKIGVETSRYAQLPNGKKSILPQILISLLSSRKDAKQKMDSETDPFKKAIWNGLQLAYKITANSLYGQTGAKTSPINKTEIAASTTAIGRQMIMFSKKHVETKYSNVIVKIDTGKGKDGKPIINKYTGMTIHLRNTYCVYGDTDSIFIKFDMWTPEGEQIKGLDAVFLSMELCVQASREISLQLKKPQNLESEKIIYPFILFAKKRYHGHYYKKMMSEKFEVNSMGIALKRRDYAPIVKIIYGGALDIIMNEHDLDKAFQFIKDQFIKVLTGEFGVEEFIISKTLKSYYKKPNQIAHNVLANRQAQRDPGARFQSNDRVPYLFMVHPNPSKDHLQGDKIETPSFIKQNNRKINYRMYLEKQIMNPITQIFDLVKGFENSEKVFTNIIDMYDNAQSGTVKLDNFFKKKTAKPLTNLRELIEKFKVNQELLAKQDIEDDDGYDYNDDAFDDDDDAFDEEGGIPTSNYDDPNF
jgi:DNA polymerase elongation subunit (family B)